MYFQTWLNVTIEAIVSMSSKQIRVDSEVMKELAKKRNGFETPNECIKRLLGENPCAVEETKEEIKDEGIDNS